MPAKQIRCWKCDRCPWFFQHWNVLFVFQLLSGCDFCWHLYNEGQHDTWHILNHPGPWASTQQHPPCLWERLTSKYHFIRLSVPSGSNTVNLEEWNSIKVGVFLHFIECLYLCLQPGVLTQTLTNQLMQIQRINGWVSVRTEWDI